MRRAGCPPLFYDRMSIDKAKLHSFYRYALDWLFPNICPCCERMIGYDRDFCEECLADLTVYTDKMSIPYIDRFTAYCVYDENSAPAILRFKHTDAGNSYYAFAYRINEALKQAGFGRDTDYIVPIPMTKESRKARGYNQAELIAKELRYMIDVPWANVLMKTRQTAQQKTLDRQGRAKNLKGAFAVDPKFGEVKGKRFLLIDDVCTTGSTFAEAAKVLKESGAAEVYAAAFAKTPKNRKDIPDADTEEAEKNFEIF